MRFKPILLFMWVFVILLSAAHSAWCYGKDGENGLSGYLEAEAIYPADRDTPKELPTTILGLEYKLKPVSWSAAKVCLRAVNDGTVIDPRDGKFFTEYNKIYQDRNPYAVIDAAYVDLYSSHADLRVGIQKFSWGVLDEINPTDVLNTEDFTHGPFYSECDRKIASPAVKADLYSRLLNMELAWLPWFVPYRLPTPEERWFPGVLTAPASIDAGTSVGSIPVTRSYQDIEVPSFSFEDSQAGARITRHIRGVDLSLMYFRGYDPAPLTETPTDLTVTITDPLAMSYDLDLGVNFVPVLHKIQVFGFDFSTPLGPFTLRGEYAYYKGKHFNRRLESILEDEVTPARQQEIVNSFMQSYIDSGGSVTSRTYHFDPGVNVKKDSMRYGLGFDYIYGDTHLSAQAIQELVPDFDENDPVYFIDNGMNTLVTAVIRQLMLQNTLEISLKGTYGIEFEEYLARPSIRYHFTDDLEGTLGALIIGGKDEKSLLGQFRQNDEVYAVLKCHF